MGNTEAIAEIEERIKSTKDRRMYERLQAIRFRLMGLPMATISNLLCRSERTLWKYIHAYEKHGLEGLIRKVSPGKSSRLSKDQREALKQVIVSQVPADVGFTAKFNWTLQLIADYIERQFGLKYSLRGVSKLMERMGMSYTKPTYTLAAADPVKQQLFRRDVPHPKKGVENGEIDHLLFEDESMIRDYQALQRTWFEKGKQRVIQTTGKHRGVKLLSTVDYCTGKTVWQEDEEYTAATFLTFLQEVLKAYPSGNICMILDNARIHHAKLLEPFLSENQRLTFEFLPPYSPQLNIVEGLWKWLKSDVINNVFYHTVAEIRKNVQSFMESIMQKPKVVIDRLCVRMESGTLVEDF